jgi:hypothetical protein
VGEQTRVNPALTLRRGLGGRYGTGKGGDTSDVPRVRDHQGPPCSYVAELLDTHVSALDTRIQELIALRDELRARRPLDTAPDLTRCRLDQVCYLIEDDASPEEVSGQ